MQSTQFCVGLEIGGQWIYWPLATLRVSARQLYLGSGFSPVLELSPDEVVAIELAPDQPWIGAYLRVRHTNPRQARPAVFYTLRDPQLVLRELAATGFVPGGHYAPGTDEAALIEEQNPLIRYPYNWRYRLVLWGVQLFFFGSLVAAVLFGSSHLTLFSLIFLTGVCGLLFELSLLLFPDWRALFLRDGVVFTAATRRQRWWRVAGLGVVVVLMLLFWGELV